MTDEVVEAISVPATKKGHFNISSFRAELGKNDVLPNHSFLVTFAPFSSMSDTTAELGKMLSDNEDLMVMRCDAAQLPAPRLITEENIRRYGYGPIETVAKTVQFTEVTLSWIVDRNAAVVDFFNTWMNLIVYHNSEGGHSMYNAKTFGDVDFDPYEVGYKDDYSNSIMTVFVYDTSMNTVLTYRIYDVFPKYIHDNNVSWAENDSIMKYNVTFAFTDMKIVAKQPMEEFSKSLSPSPFKNKIITSFKTTTV